MATVYYDQGSNQVDPIYYNAGVANGTPNQISLTTDYPLVIAPRQFFIFTASQTNTGPVTVSINGSNYFPLTLENGSTLPSNAIVANRTYLIFYTSLSTFSVVNYYTNSQFSSVNVTNFGADPTGVADSTTALQAALNYALPLGLTLDFSPGSVFKITSSLTVPFSQGWTLRGGGRFFTRIIQYTNNTPIFNFTSSLTHSFKIYGLSLEYNTSQVYTNTLSKALYFDPPNSGTIFNFTLEQLMFVNCQDCAGINPSKSSVAIWGVRAVDCTQAGSVSGSFTDLSCAVAVGQPMIRYDHCYFDCTSAKKPTINIVAGDEVTLTDVEFNNGTYGGAGNAASQINVSTSSEVILLGVKSEVYTTAGTALWDFPNSKVTAIGFKQFSGTDTVGGAVAIRANSGGQIGALINGFVSCSGNANTVYNSGKIGFVCAVTAGGSTNLNPRAVLGNVSVAGITADNKVSDAITSNGDVTVTLTSLSDKIQRFNTTLTANRSVNLPTTGLVDGMEFEIVRDASTPGAFTLTVVDGLSGKNYTIASSTKGFVRYRAVGTGAWMIVSAGTLP